MRHHSRWYALGGGLTGLFLVLPLAAPPVAAQPDQRGAKPRVSMSYSSWTVKSTRQSYAVRTTYPRSTPPKTYVGKPADVQVMRSDGSWETVGTAAQKRVKDKPKTVARVRFTFPASGRIRVRARVHPTSGTVKSRQRLVRVRDENVRFDPVALPKTGNFCAEASIADLEHIVYSCGAYIGQERSFAYNHETRKRKRFGRKGTQRPIVADRAPIVVDAKPIKRYSDFYRARRIDLRTGKSRPLAYKRNGKPVRISDAHDISDDGRLAVYSSKARGIVKNAPKGWNLYLKRQGRKRSTHIARGSAAQISGNGRFVVWVNGSGKVRRMNVRSGRVRTVRGARPTGSYSGPSINRSGRYIAYIERMKGKRTRAVRVTDIRTGTTWTAGKGNLPTISPDGSKVAYRTHYESDLYVWSRATKKRTFVSVGRDGRGDLYHEVWTPDFSADGRYLLAHIDSALIAPDNGSDIYDGRNDLILFDLAGLEGEAR